MSRRNLFYDDWNHTRVRGIITKIQLLFTTERNRTMYIAAFVFGHDVDSYFLRTLENAA